MFESLLSYGLPFLAAALGSIYTKPQIQGWYIRIKKAPWNPPNFVFGPVWTMLYLAMGHATLIITKSIAHDSLIDLLKSRPIQWYLFQLVLNAAWSPLFFSGHFGYAMIDILIMSGAIYKTIQEYAAISHFAASFLYPYLAWVAYASTLNLYIWLYNNKPKVE
jgi:benzodiazapine receptor